VGHERAVAIAGEVLGTAGLAGVIPFLAVLAVALKKFGYQDFTIIFVLAGLACYGPQRTQVFAPLPKWRREAKRPSCLDLITLLRQQMNEKPAHFQSASAPPTYNAMVGTAAA
jgi:hypothetical protein